MEKTNIPILQDLTDGNARIEHTTNTLKTDCESTIQTCHLPSLFYETLQTVKYAENLSDDDNALNTSDEESDADMEIFASTPTRPTEDVFEETHTRLPVKDRNGSTDRFQKSANSHVEVKKELPTNDAVALLRNQLPSSLRNV